MKFPDSVPRAGEPIIGAIARFATELGAPPETLAELVPKYLAAIPVPNWGTRKWEYSRGEGSPHFSLCVRRQHRALECCSYANSDEERRGWSYDSSPGELTPEGREMWRARSPYS